MAFCKYCGKELTDNEVCSCQNANSIEDETIPNSNSEVLDATMERFVKKIKDVPSIVLGIFKNPVREGKRFILESDKIISICIILIHAFVVALFSLEIIGNANSIINEFTQVLGDLIPKIEIELSKSFFSTLLISAIISCIFGLLFWLGNKIIKNEVTVNQVIAFVALRSITIIPCVIVSMIAYFLIPYAGFIIFYLSIILTICLLMTVYKNTYTVNEDKITYMFFIMFLIFIIISVFVMFKSTSLYVPGAIKKLLDFSFEDIFDLL